MGGVIAINGKTGSMIWQLWLTRMVLAVHCEFEITSDEVSDCVVTGKGGVRLLEILNTILTRSSVISRTFADKLYPLALSILLSFQLLLAVSGIDGSVIWQLESVSESELYNVLITHDVNQDGFLDIIASHYMQNKSK